MKPVLEHTYTALAQRTHINEMLCAYSIVYCSSCYVCLRVSFQMVLFHIVAIGFFLHCHYIWLVLIFFLAHIRFIIFFWVSFLGIFILEIRRWIRTNRSSHRLIWYTHTLVCSANTKRSGFLFPRNSWTYSNDKNNFFAFLDQRFSSVLYDNFFRLHLIVKMSPQT